MKVKKFARNKRPKGWTQPDWWMPADQFREVLAWLDKTVLAAVIHYGGEGVEASDFVLMFHDRLDAPQGWYRLASERQRKQVWNCINRLCERRLIETYHSKQRHHNRSRVRLREVNVLDRLVHALEKNDE